MLAELISLLLSLVICASLCSRLGHCVLAPVSRLREAVLGGVGVKDWARAATSLRNRPLFWLKGVGALVASGHIAERPSAVLVEGGWRATEFAV